MLKLPTPLPKRLFITGTDTEIGKTVCTVALLKYLNAQGLKTLALKPVASGCTMTSQGLRNEDALALMAASSTAAEYDKINPWAYEPAISPHLAASAHDGTITQQAIDQHLAMLPQHDVLVIEGAGGWLSPISATLTNQDLCKAYDAIPILVVGLKLGCINHACLSAQAMMTEHRPLGWIGNTLDPKMPALVDNITSLQQRLPMPYLGQIDYQGP